MKVSRPSAKYITHSRRKKPREALSEAHFAEKQLSNHKATSVTKKIGDDGSGKGKYVDVYA